MESKYVEKKIPLGLSSYKEIKEEGYYYVDKTQYIQVLEKLSTKYPILLRPRRFGKTLFADMLKCYYDIREKENFDHLFEDTYIGRHKTDLANTYYVLHFNFSALDTRDAVKLEESFGGYIKVAINAFLRYYRFDMMLNEKSYFILYMQEFMYQLTDFIGRKKLYIIIDEYDHFANSLLGSKNSFQAATSKDGFIRNFYEVLKKHTQDVLDRIFITGVTSLTLDSLTSGFNICTNVSEKVNLNAALGFTHDEVLSMTDHMKIPDQEGTLKVLKESYNGYLFSRLAKERIYNSNMILYYMSSYVDDGAAPRQLADPNIRGDYLKLSSMLDLYDSEDKETVLQDLMCNKCVTGRLVSSFSLIGNFSHDQFVSLLYYLGLLTLDEEAEDGKYQLKTPNNVIRDIYYEYYFNYITEIADISMAMVTEALEAFEHEDISPLTAVIESVLDDFTKVDNRYMIHFRENSLQTLFFLMLRQSRNYNARIEYNIDGSYIDILYTPIGGGSPFAIELKYISTARYKENKYILKETIASVHSQLEADMTRLSSARGVAIVFVGKRCSYKNLIK